MHLGSSTYVLPSNYLKQASAHGSRETFLETKSKVRADKILPILHQIYAPFHQLAKIRRINTFLTTLNEEIDIESAMMFPCIMFPRKSIARSRIQEKKRREKKKKKKQTGSTVSW